jgi:hypothetical protein
MQRIEAASRQESQKKLHSAAGMREFNHGDLKMQLPRPSL